MTGGKTFRALGVTICVFALMYYSFQILQFLSHWYSLEDIGEYTECTQLYVLEIWLLTQSVLWVIGITLMLIVLIKPELYKLLLCFLYLMGPVYFVWTAVSAACFSSFIACCKEVEDECKSFYPFTNPGNFVILIAISLFFSAMVSLYLFSILVSVFWHHINRYIQNYRSLLY
jgi:hypothetical protein